MTNRAPDAGSRKREHDYAMFTAALDRVLPIVNYDHELRIYYNADGWDVSLTPAYAEVLPAQDDPDPTPVGAVAGEERTQCPHTSGHLEAFGRQCVYHAEHQGEHFSDLKEDPTGQPFKTPTITW